jgi:hypothetical protein
VEILPSTEAPTDPFQRIKKLDEELAVERVLVEKNKTKTAKLEHNIVV